MENSHEEKLFSAVEDFSPQPSPTPADFSDSDRHEMEEEEPRGFGVRLYTFELLSTAGSAAELTETQAHPCPRVQDESSVFLKHFPVNA